MRKLLEWLPQQYMLDTLEENPGLAKYHAGDEMYAALFGHYLFIGGTYDREAACFLAKNMLAEYGTLAFCPDDAWKNGLREVLGDITVGRRAMYQVKPYACAVENPSIKRIDADALARFKNAEIFIEEVTDTGTYDSMEDFFARGIGFAPVFDGALRGFCTSEYPSRGKCAIGIMVEDEYRKRGLAIDMTRAFINAAYEKGLHTVYWECWANNTPSVKTALACGFEKVAEYEVLGIWR